MTYGNDPSLFKLSAAPSATEGEQDAPTNSLEDLPLFGDLEDEPEVEVEVEAEVEVEVEVEVEIQAPREEPVVEESIAEEPIVEILFDEEATGEEQLEVVFEAPVEPPVSVETTPSEGPATMTDRLGAALLDLAVMVAAAIALAGGAAVLGAPPQPSDWPLIAFPLATLLVPLPRRPDGFLGSHSGNGIDVSRRKDARRSTAEPGPVNTALAGHPGHSGIGRNTRTPGTHRPFRYRSSQSVGHPLESPGGIQLVLGSVPAFAHQRHRDPQVAKAGRQGEHNERGRARPQSDQAAYFVDHACLPHRREGQSPKQEERVPDQQQPDCRQGLREILPDEEDRQRQSNHRLVPL